MLDWENLTVLSTQRKHWLLWYLVFKNISWRKHQLVLWILRNSECNEVFQSYTGQVKTRLGICNRNQVNLRNFRWEDFSFRTDPEGNRYVSIFTQREEENHRGDDSTDNHSNQTRMYEMPGWILPPCFDKYYVFEYITNFLAHLIMFILFFQGYPRRQVNKYTLPSWIQAILISLTKIL